MLFKGNMRSPNFKYYFMSQKLPHQHCLFMYNDSKHTSGSTRELNHVETPAQSSGEEF